MSHLPSGSRRRAHILCADPNASYLRLYLRELEPLGHVIMVAASGMDALEQLKMYPVDLAFIAMELPDVAGRDVIHRIRSVLGLTSLPIVVTSNGSAEKSLGFVADYTNVVVLRKPFSGARLSTLVVRLLPEGS